MDKDLTSRDLVIILAALQNYFDGYKGCESILSQVKVTWTKCMEMYKDAVLIETKK